MAEDNDVTPDPAEEGAPVDARFLLEVMEGLQGTNFAHGWSPPGMYEEFLAWCDRSEEADEIIARHYDEIPVLVLDEAEGVRMVSLRAQTATVLMRALLEAFENRRVRKLLGE